MILLFIYKMFFYFLFYFYFFILTKSNDIENSRMKTLSLIKDNIDKLEKENFKIEKELDLNIENINDIYKEFIQEKPNHKFTIKNRIILRTSYIFKNEIKIFDFLYSKSMAKNDNGLFVNILLLGIEKNNVSLFDLDNNLLSNITFPFEIDEMITMKVQDENEIFLISKNRTNLYKYKLKIRKDISDNFTKSSNNNILVKSYIDEFNKNPHNIYNLSYSYIYSLKKLFFILTQRGNIFYFNNTNEKIISTQTVMTKGLKYIVIYSNLGYIYKLKVWDMLIENKEDFTLFKNKTPYLFSTFAFYTNDNNDSLSIYNIKNSSNLLSNCYFKTKNEKIINLFYDSLLRILIIATNNSNLYFAFPSIYKVVKQEECIFEYFTEISISVKNNIYLNIIRRILYISNKEKEMEIIDLNDLDFHKINILNNKIRKNIIDIGEDKNESLIKEPKFIKTGNEQYMIMKENQNKLLLYHIPNINSKIKGSEEISFNFKIPIIIVALVIIFVVNYIKKKNEKDEFEKRKLKNQVIEEIRKYGGSGKKFKED